MNSLRLRVIVSAVLWSAIALLIAGIVIWRLFAASAERQFDATLEAHLSELASAIAVTDRTQAQIEARMADPRFHGPLSGLYWQISAPDGEMRRSRSLWDGDLALPVDELSDGMLHRHDVAGPDTKPARVLERTVITPRDGAWRIAVAAESAGLENEKVRFLRSLMISLAVLGAALATAAIVQAALALMPLARLQDAAGAHRQGETSRIEGQFPKEIAPVVDDLNATLAGNEKLTARARRRAADLAHALKTPVAALQNTLDEMPVDPADPAMTTAREALHRIDIQTRRQLALARIAVAPPGPGVEIGQTLDRLVRAMTHIHPGKKIEVATSEDGDARFRGDAEDLEEMLGNLLDNACKWAARLVTISITMKGDMVEIAVEDDGPGVPDEMLDRIAMAGTRLDETMEGSGLGLAIVSDIVDAYDGTINFVRSGGGSLIAVLQLPGSCRRA